MGYDENWHLHGKLVSAGLGLELGFRRKQRLEMGLHQI